MYKCIFCTNVNQETYALEAFDWHTLEVCVKFSACFKILVSKRLKTN